MDTKIQNQQDRNDYNSGNANLSKVVLVGNPNVGKSVFFNKFTGTYVEVSNYPGTTVDISKAVMKNSQEKPTRNPHQKQSPIQICKNAQFQFQECIALHAQTQSKRHCQKQKE